jgi:hypothetical protein
MFNQGELQAFVSELLKEKNYESFSESELNDAKADLMERLVAQLEIALISKLDDDKANELADRLESEDLSDDEIGQFMRENGVNIEEITSKTKEDFKKFFLEKDSDAENGAEGEN